MATPAYKPDTLVVDVPAPTRRRQITEVDVHVLVEGRWHKRVPDHSFTSCGKHKIHSEFHQLRHPALIGRLCDECFTEHERAEADRNNTAEFEKVT
jgi:hypothetical protein